MEYRIALIGIILEDRHQAKAVNDLLSQYADFIVGRMGMPEVSQGVHVISLIVKGPQEVISSLSGKVGMIPKVNCKALYAKQTVHHG